MGRRLHVIPLLAFGALVTACHEAERVFAPRPGRLHPSVSATQPLTSKIVFYSNRDGDFGIYAMNLDGSGVTQLTNNPADEFLPLWSPDGTRITFGRCAGGTCDVVVINADGGGETVATHDGFPGAWSPDSRQIAFGRSDGIFVVNVDGSGLVRVADPQFVTGWSPDGRQLLLGNDSDGDFEIYALNLDGSGTRQLTNNAANDGGGRWSPDGTRIAFNSDRDGGDIDIFVMNADGSNVNQLTQNDVFTDGGPAWSSDASRIAFDSDRDGDEEIYMMNADGSSVTQLTFNDRIVDAGPQIQPVPHDVAVTRFATPNAASSGQTRRIVVSINSKRYAETVEVQLFRSVPGGFQQFGSLTQFVPTNPKSGTTEFAFTYTFTPDDAQIGKVTFRAVAVVAGVRDALPADNEAISPPTKVSR